MVGRSKAVPWDARIETMREQMLAPPFHHPPFHHHLWQQSDNVPFEQSRNVPLTVPGWWDGTRTTTDDAG